MQKPSSKPYLKERHFEFGETITIVCKNIDNYGNVCNNDTLTFSTHKDYECFSSLITFYCDRCKRAIMVRQFGQEIFAEYTNEIKYGNSLSKHMPYNGGIPSNVLPAKH